MSYKFKKIVYVGGIEYLPCSTDHLGIIQGFEQLKLNYYFLDDIIKYDTKESLVEKILEINPDLIIYGQTRPLSKLVPVYLKERGYKGFQLFWMMDCRRVFLDNNKIVQEYMGHWNEWTRNKDALDFILLSNKDQLNFWSKEFNTETAYLPQACWIPNKLEYNKDFKFSCIFIGGQGGGEYGFQDRIDLLNKIKEKINFEWINGGGIDERKKIWMDMPKYYYSSNTSLDIAHFWNNPGYTSNRYFIISTLGGLSITKRFPDCEKLFPEPYKRYFDTAEEAIELITYYQSHKKEREKLKIAAANYAWKNHSYKKRFKQLFDIINHKNKPYE